MTRKILFTVAIVCGAALAGCDSSPTDPDSSRPQFDGRSRNVPMNTTTSGGSVGDPCDPVTYEGPYRCIPDPNNANGYIISY
ncbi:MAG TPA: hypothetical protein VF035_06470 [Longimicrobiales bacterium]